MMVNNEQAICPVMNIFWKIQIEAHFFELTDVSTFITTQRKKANYISEITNLDRASANGTGASIAVK